jgi:elongation factor P
MYTKAGNLKKGEFIFYQGEIWQVQKAEFYSPGKGSALMKTRLKNIISTKNIDYTYKSNEDVQLVEVESVEMQYLYQDNDNLHFMDERNYNQYSLPLAIVGEVAKYFKEGNKYYVYLHDEKPINVKPPLSVKFKIVQTEEAAKGDTVTNARKPAILENGVTVMVPLFVKVGDLITINPETGQYVERVKE